MSQDSAKDARDLIMRVKPDSVVIELDLQRLAVLLFLNALSDDEITQIRRDMNVVKKTTAEKLWMAMRCVGEGEVFKTIRSEMVNFVTRMTMALDGQGSLATHGQEFLAAVDAARAVGANIVLGDREIDLTVKRLWARVDRGSYIYDKIVEDARAMAAEKGKTLPRSMFADPGFLLELGCELMTFMTTGLLDGSSSALVAEVQEDTVKAAVDGLKWCGCGADEAEGAIAAAGKAWAGHDISVQEYLNLRRVTHSFIGSMMRGRVGDDNPYDSVSNAYGTTWNEEEGVDEPVGLFSWAHDKTYLEERDVVLAQSIFQCALCGPALKNVPTSEQKKVVAIVGAAHVPGIQRNWVGYLRTCVVLLYYLWCFHLIFLCYYLYRFHLKFLIIFHLRPSSSARVVLHLAYSSRIHVT